MKVYRLNKSGRGKFLLPHSAGGRRCGYTSAQSVSTNGKGLLLSPQLGGFGVSQVEKQVGYVNPPVISSAVQQKLQSLPVRSGLGMKKKKLINLKF